MLKAHAYPAITRRPYRKPRGRIATLFGRRVRVLWWHDALIGFVVALTFLTCLVGGLLWAR